MSDLVKLPDDVEKEVDALLEAGHPLSMSVSSTKFLAEQNGCTALAKFLEDAENAGKYVSYVMTLK
jgi:hypothetical protein